MYAADGTRVTFDTCSFEGNAVTAADASSLSVAAGGQAGVALVVTVEPFGAFQGGAVFARCSSGAKPVHVIVAGSAFARNKAPKGGALAAIGNVSIISTACTFQGNAASQGGVAYVTGGGPTGAVIPAVSFSGNCSFVKNTAEEGAVFFTASNPACFPLLVAGGGGGGGGAPEPAGWALQGNVAANYGSFRATLPTTWRLEAAATARSGARLPLSVVLADALNQTVTYWKDAVITAGIVANSSSAAGSNASAAEPNATLSGGGSAVQEAGVSTAPYTGAVAAFADLIVRGLPLTSNKVLVTVSSPTFSDVLADAPQRTASFTIEECGFAETLDVANLVCVCTPNSVYNPALPGCVCTSEYYMKSGGTCAGELALRLPGDPPGFALALHRGKGGARLPRRCLVPR